MTTKTGGAGNAAVASLLADVSAEPTASRLWELRRGLLLAGIAPTNRVFGILREFHAFADELATRTSSRAYSNLASRMDIGALGGLVASEMIDSGDAETLASRLTTGVITEGLAVLATRQHVHAWDGELAAVCRSAAWFLYGALWEWSCERRPELPHAMRSVLIEQMLEPALSTKSSAEVKAVVLGRLFLVVLADAVYGAVIPEPT